MSTHSARAFWSTTRSRRDPQRGPAGTGRGPGARAYPLFRDQSRHRDAGVQRPGTRARNINACARRSRTAIFRRRSSTVTSASAKSSKARASCSGARCFACIRIRICTWSPPTSWCPCRKLARRTRGACRQHGNRGQCAVGRAPQLGDRISVIGAGTLGCPGRLARLAHSGYRGRTGRHQSGAGADRGGAGPCLRASTTRQRNRAIGCFIPARQPRD